MTHWKQGHSFSRNRNLRWKKRLRQLAQMRAAKERKRRENPQEREPEFVRHYPLEFGIRVKATGEYHFVDLKSVRHAAKALGLILKFIPNG